MRNKAIGGDDADVGGKMVAQLYDLVETVRGLGQGFADRKGEMPATENCEAVTALNQALEDLLGVFKTYEPTVNVVNESSPALNRIILVLARTIRHSIFPLLRSMDQRLANELKTHDKLAAIAEQVERVEESIRGEG
jgi:hypothetical protein